MLRRVLLLASVAALLTGCVATPAAPTSPAGATASGTPSAPAAFSLEQLPVIDGSTANVPLISLAVQRLTGVSAEEADKAVQTTGTSNSYQRLVSREADLLVVYEPDEQTKQVISEPGEDGPVELESHAIGRDALVFFTNESNPVTSLTTKQYRQIYTGKIKNWSQVGGDDQPIVAYQRPETSGSQALLRKYVVGDAKLAEGPSNPVADDMGTIIEGVSDYKNTGNALGYSVYYYLANMYAVPGIKMLAVGGVQPSTETIADGSYPYTNDFSVVIRADEPDGSPARQVMNWLLSADGAQTVVDAGYAPVG